MKISWYPGHMNKARKELVSSLRKAQAAIEILDARAPAASSNPLLAEMTAGLPVLKILNKSDLADEEVTAAWIRHFNTQNHNTAISSQIDKQNLLTRVSDFLEQLAIKKLDEVTVRHQVIVLGCPNVGKSTVVNALAGRKVAAAGNEPAFTKGQQQIKLNEQWMLIDTPGMMWPNLEDQRAALCLALVGSIRQTALDIEDIGWASAELIQGIDSNALQQRYSLPDNQNSTEALMMAIATKVGAVSKTGKINWHKAAETLLNDYRSGKLGHLSLETPLTAPENC